jgi:hypothetical protein
MVSLREVYIHFSHEKRERKLEVKKKIRKKDLNMREDKGQCELYDKSMILLKELVIFWTTILPKI